MMHDSESRRVLNIRSGYLRRLEQCWYCPHKSLPWEGDEGLKCFFGKYLIRILTKENINKPGFLGMREVRDQKWKR